eukprot:CAMPEP_0206058660 /NCGR_PEP_ID=MMETSP1466-20131121/47180_1 /ASSEMBLY_ACC=CAM_ASM_001126 /TAXON_ID=44452 /ORGANISM="Pavlova gyrans, Strain CCMP608" /LENGTH=393 /DNA_ID=CAMNT_0053433957 /DNA_START=53 /DNA_END=1234 /DNA_ORIENTATION=-
MPPEVEQPVRQKKKQVGSSVPPTDEEIADGAFLELVDRGAHEEAINLLKKGQQINVADERGETPVHKATRRGDKDFVVQLLKLGAVADYPDVDGVTPIMIAVQYGRSDLTQIFMQKEVDLQSKTRDGMSLLHTAVYSGHEDVIRSLLMDDKVCELLETKDNNGRTPLQVASFRSSKEVCEMLVDAGADFATRDKRGNTCATLAQRSGRRNSKDFFDRLANAGPGDNAPDEPHAIPRRGSRDEALANQRIDAPPGRERDVSIGHCWHGSQGMIGRQFDVPGRCGAPSGLALVPLACKGRLVAAQSAAHAMDMDMVTRNSWAVGGPHVQGNEATSPGIWPVTASSDRSNTWHETAVEPAHEPTTLLAVGSGRKYMSSVSESHNHVESATDSRPRR